MKSNYYKGAGYTQSKKKLLQSPQMRKYDWVLRIKIPVTQIHGLMYITDIMEYVLIH